MLNVTSYERDFYISEKSMKKLIVKIGEGDSQFQLKQSQIIGESMELTETLSADNDIKFVGCNSSQFKLQVTGVSKKMKGKAISVGMSITGYPDLPLFHGKIDSDERTANKRIKEIIAYDSLYDLANRDVTTWFNSLSFPMTLKNFRNKFFAEIGITQKNPPNQLLMDDYIIPNPKDFVKENTSSTIYAINVAKSICQLCGVFGIINRDNKFEYRQLAKWEESGGAILGNTLTLPFILGKGSVPTIPDAQYYPRYRSVTYEDYDVERIDSIKVAQDKDGASGICYKSGYRYCIYGNLLTRYSPESYTTAPDGELYSVATFVNKNVEDVKYTPFSAVAAGLPFLEVGDAVQFYVYDFEKSEKQKKDVHELKTFIILNRTMKGIMALTDTLSAKGQKRTKEIVSDLGFKNDDQKVIEKKVDKNTEDIEEIKESSFKVESVSALPASPESNTIYLIQGTVG